jgi:RNA polymerase sigma factor, sigma-70 family
MQLLIQGCKRNDRDSQRLLYQHYYPYAYSICIRYSRNREEAKEVVNDGFMKVFGKIDQYDLNSSFKGWIRKIMINSSIDQYRKELKHQNPMNVDSSQVRLSEAPVILSDLSHEDLIVLIQRLSPAYRAVFNLHVIDGHTHDEIGKMLNISAGTSKSNLTKARENLRKMLGELNKIAYEKVN